MRSLALSVAALAASVPLHAQTYAYSPAGTATKEGNNNNTIPIWSSSSTYQQIHDYENMVATLNGLTPLLTGLSFRQNGGGGAIAGRTFTVQITAGATSTSSSTFSTTFANNLGSAPTVVLPYTAISFPNLNSTSSPNPPGIVVPWTTPFAFPPSQGTNLCWEWRHHSATSNAIGALDAVSGNDLQSAAREGVGCQASGQTQPAEIGTYELNLRTQVYRNRLDHAAANAGAVFVIGAQRANLQLPGQCQPLLTNPLVFFSGGTDPAGQWDLSIPTPDLRGQGQAEILGQFVWLDAGLPVGLGVSDMSAITTPLAGSWFMTRLYAAPYQGGAGLELATTAIGSDRGYGLVVGFTTP
jgi:hypothetical protein